MKHYREKQFDGLIRYGQARFKMYSRWVESIRSLERQGSRDGMQNRAIMFRSTARRRRVRS